ncbi:Type 1 glutamine amidotransferase-like domain-containing protein [Metasolibacillus meyeri]|uniref:Type 1 glutamine amidotransferase-like domain-containing protein n=1 Tax=Metasolibacillus meyeri TaxID=1071052 RepID=UPI001EE6EEC9|nr:Type 1 glutamine amidotransferase-like domain-containing protein [Metasolibacillus meyeri]
MKLLLTSNGFYTDAIKKQFLKLLNSATNELDVAIITTASPQKENNRFAQKAKEDFKEMGFHKIDFIDVEFDNPESLKHKDVIYINGGNPFNLLFYTKRNGADTILQQLITKNVVIVGVSAGAVLLGPNIKVVHFFTPQMDALKTKDFSALGLTDKLVFPHYDREDLFQDSSSKTIEARLKEFESLEKCNITRLKDDEYILIEK